MMIIYAILTAVLLGIINLLTIWGAYKWIKRLSNGFFVSPGPDKPSQFALIIDVIAGAFSQKIMASIKGITMNGSSVATRQANAIQGALITDIASQQNPLMGAALAQFPALRKLITKNPQLLDLAVNLMSKTASPKDEKVPAGSNGHDDYMTIR